MSPWTLAIWGLLPPFAAAVAFALRGTLATRIVAVQFASVVATLILEAMTFAYDQDAYSTMALAAALMGTAGTLVVAMSVERWL